MPAPRFGGNALTGTVLPRTGPAAAPVRFGGGRDPVQMLTREREAAGMPGPSPEEIMTAAGYGRYIPPDGLHARRGGDWWAWFDREVKVTALRLGGSYAPVPVIPAPLDTDPATGQRLRANAPQIERHGRQAAAHAWAWNMAMQSRDPARTVIPAADPSPAPAAVPIAPAAPRWLQITS